MIQSTGLNLTNATVQDVFDFVVFSLIQQAKPSIEGANCVYRADDGCRCGVGHVISNDEYSPSFEGKTIDRLFDTQFSGSPQRLPSLRAWVRADRQVPRLKFLRALQQTHDQAYGQARDKDVPWTEAFRANARLLAQEYHLDASITAYREASEYIASRRVSRGTMGRWPNEFAGAPRPRELYARPYPIIGADDEIPDHINGL